MARYRCVFARATVGTSGREPGLEVAYEFEAPDVSTLRAWLKERQAEPCSIHEVPQPTAGPATPEPRRP
jgi:hypothetical protein